MIWAISMTTVTKMPNQIIENPTSWNAGMFTIGSTTAMVSTTAEMPSRKHPITM